jgi:hypothetical protein
MASAGTKTPTPNPESKRWTDVPCKLRFDEAFERTLARRGLDSGKDFDCYLCCECHNPLRGHRFPKEDGKEWDGIRRFWCTSARGTDMAWLWPDGRWYVSGMGVKKGMILLWKDTLQPVDVNDPSQCEDLDMAETVIKIDTQQYDGSYVCRPPSVSCGVQ